MPLFGKVDAALPLLTQFIQIEMPAPEVPAGAASRPPRTLREVSPLFGSEIDEWLLRQFKVGLLGDDPLVFGEKNAADLKALVRSYPEKLTRLQLGEMQFAPLCDGDGRRYYSELFPLGQRETCLRHLLQLSSLHYHLVYAAFWWAHTCALSGPDSVNRTDQHINQLLAPINARINECRPGIVLSVKNCDGILCPSERAIAPDHLETLLLGSFLEAFKIPVGYAGGFDTCPVCDYVYHRERANVDLCSHRCRDREKHRKGRTSKKS